MPEGSVSGEAHLVALDSEHYKAIEHIEVHFGLIRFSKSVGYAMGLYMAFMWF